ncbi:sperm flagellar protein 1 [Drosophila kikkawai]|uniref:Sperm flagellar protein 1 n=1 Tax=Drosophila kikkawai TaxID=30033 RepID=A0A6P4IZB2_DROKI|nr:sperm flagellar protein 1 [Drosophila kikkawai]
MPQYHTRTLNSEEEVSLAQWLKEQRIVLNLRTRRFFSDVLPVAKIIKLAHPRLVDLHNYAPKNSIQLKLKNWEIFDTKVLKKLNVSVPHALLEKLAQAEAGAIEMLFYELIPVTKGHRGPMPSPLLHDDPRLSPMGSSRNPAPLGVLKHSNKQQLCRSRTIIRSHKVSCPSPTGDDLPAEVLSLDVDTLVDGKIEKVAKKLVAYEDYAVAVRASNEKDNYIKMIHQKVDYLQSLIAVKDERISDLMDQLAKLSDQYKYPSNILTTTMPRRGDEGGILPICFKGIQRQILA